MPKVAIFSVSNYVVDQMRPLTEKWPGSKLIESPCTPSTAALCHGCEVVCLFVNDTCNREVVEVFKQEGIKMVAMRCAGYDRVDVKALAEAGIKCARVPAYSPYAVAEQAVTLAMALNRRIHKAYVRVREGNFTLSGLVGFDMNGKTVGIVSTGKIGTIAAQCFKGFGCKIVGYDMYQNDHFKKIGEYVSMDELVEQSHIISLHTPLMPATRHIVNKELIKKMRDGVILVNCSRGGLVNTEDLVNGIISGKIGGAGLDVYEDEEKLFFQNYVGMDVADRMPHWDRTFAMLQTLPNVIVTPHTAFLTKEALTNICNTTIQNIVEFEEGKELTNAVVAPVVKLPRVAIFSVSQYVVDQMKPLMDKFPGSKLIESACCPATASLCHGCEVVCLFVNDTCDKEVVEIFKEEGVKMVAMRCAGYDRVDVKALEAAGIKCARVPAYSPYAVAEQAVTLALCLNRKIHKAYVRVREGNFTLSGLVGFDMNGKTVGIVSTGKIGTIAAQCFKGFGCRIIGFDMYQNDHFKQIGEYVSMDELVAESDIISLHTPLMPATKHMVNKELIGKMRNGVILVNCSRGGLVNTKDLVDGITSGKIGGAGLDVYEDEENLFFQNYVSMDVVDRMPHWDNTFAMLQALPNVIVTPHTAFLTEEALMNICNTTIQNVMEFHEGKELTNAVKS